MIDFDKYFSFENSQTIITDFPCFDPFLCADCGQAFRWIVSDDKKSLSGVIGHKEITIFSPEKGKYIINSDKDYFQNVLFDYFDLGRDYQSILDSYDEDNLKSAVAANYGIRILKQDEWETLCSFIISQNNNIPRIKGIIERLCESYGDRLEHGRFSFPSAETLSNLSVEDLSPLRAGFRSKYIIDAAEKVSSGEVSFEKIHVSDLSASEDELIKIKGVGKKVAQCTLLFGFGKIDAFPVDVWIKRACEDLYPDGFPTCAKGTEGIAQQYLFKWYREKE